MKNVVNRASLGAKKNLNLLLSSRLKNHLSLVVGSELTRSRLGVVSLGLRGLATLLMVLTIGVGSAWGA